MLAPKGFKISYNEANLFNDIFLFYNFVSLNLVIETIFSYSDLDIRFFLVILPEISFPLKSNTLSFLI
jgi:hypothetical protein